MVKKLKKYLLTGLIVFAFGCTTVNAASFNVQDEKGLKDAILKAKSDDTIVLDKNVTLRESLNVDKSIILDLNGKTVVVSGNSSSIRVGKKEAKSIKERAINFAKLKFKKEHRFNYDDNMKVTIKNGIIVHSNGLSGKNGVENSWFNYCGKKGTTPVETIGLESGKLFLDTVYVYAGNGGNGGSGAPQAAVNFIGGGGIGGRGGEAGNGGNAVKIFRKGCKLELGKDVVLKAGRSGKVGKNSDVNPKRGKWYKLKLKATNKPVNGKKVLRSFLKN